MFCVETYTAYYGVLNALSMNNLLIIPVNSATYQLKQLLYWIYQVYKLSFHKQFSNDAINSEFLILFLNNFVLYPKILNQTLKNKISCGLGCIWCFSVFFFLCTKVNTVATIKCQTQRK